MKPYSAQGIAAASGAAEVDLTPPAGYTWLVQHIGILSTSSLNCICSCYLNERFICGSDIGTADSADGSPVPVRWSDKLRFVWANCSSGAVCTVQLLVDEFRAGSPMPGQ